MAAFLHCLATRVPQFACEQEVCRERLKGWAGERRTQRLIHAAHQRSGIRRRHSVLPDFTGEAVLYAEGGGEMPGTGRRNALYGEEAGPLAAAAAGDCLRQAAAECGLGAEEVTHVIFVSCTGFTNPGADLFLVEALGLRSDVQRYVLGFMGCCAAFPALRMASQFVAADPGAVVLVVCLELCTLHMQLDDRPDSVLANALFADGAAAGLVCGRLLAGGWALEGFATRVLPASGGAMAWGVGDHGFDLVLSSYVPDLLAVGIRELLLGALEGQGWGLDGVEHWAVHPGGRVILDKVEKALDLGAGALGASREVLASYGNMSSPTILFVLAALGREMSNRSGSGSCVGLAFGPGLTVEMGFWRWLRNPG